MSNPEKIVYRELSNEKQLVFKGSIYTLIGDLTKNGTLRWRCLLCKKHALITKGNFIFKEPKPGD